jgi:hypothetical protein
VATDGGASTAPAEPRPEGEASAAEAKSEEATGDVIVDLEPDE